MIDKKRERDADWEEFSKLSAALHSAREELFNREAAVEEARRNVSRAREALREAKSVYLRDTFSILQRESWDSEDAAELMQNIKDILDVAFDEWQSEEILVSTDGATSPVSVARGPVSGTLLVSMIMSTRGYSYLEELAESSKSDIKTIMSKSFVLLRIVTDEIQKGNFVGVVSDESVLDIIFTGL